jgi:hypothetical protein
MRSFLLQARSALAQQLAEATEALEAARSGAEADLRDATELRSQSDVGLREPTELLEATRSCADMGSAACPLDETVDQVPWNPKPPETLSDKRELFRIRCGFCYESHSMPPDAVVLPCSLIKPELFIAC